MRQRVFRRLRRNRAGTTGAAISAVFILVALLAPWIAPYDFAAQDTRGAQQLPSPGHWFGTDELGRDILSRVMFGARISLSVGASAVVVGLALGATIGVVGGYFGGWWDYLLMRMVDMLMAMPAILLSITIIAILGTDLTNVVIALAVYSVPMFARLARGSTLSVRQMEYIYAARALGAVNGRIVLRHVLPNVTGPLIVQSTLRVATAILTASSLSFLGLGAQPPTPEWGAMLATGRNYLSSAPHIALFPGVTIMLVVVGINLLGDALRDALDPRQRDL